MNANTLPPIRGWQTGYADNPSSGYPHLLGLALGLSLTIHLLVLAIWLNIPPQQMSLALPETDLAIRLQNNPAKPISKISRPTKNQAPEHIRKSHPRRLKPATTPVSRASKIRQARQTIAKPAQTSPINTQNAKTTITAAQPFRTNHHTQTRKPTAQISLSRVISRLRQDLKQYFYYPRLARQKNIQGAVILGFAINLQGKIKNIHLVKSSGFAILDNAAEDALRQLNRLSWEQDYLQRNNRHLELPVIYKLTES